MNLFTAFAFTALTFAAAENCNDNSCVESENDLTSLMQLNNQVRWRSQASIQKQLEMLAATRSDARIINRVFTGADSNIKDEEICSKDSYQPSLMEVGWTENALDWTNDHCAHMLTEDADAWIAQNMNGKHDKRIFSKLCKTGKAPEFIEPLAGLLRDPRFGCAPRANTDLFSVDWLVWPENKAEAKKCAEEGEMCICDGVVTYGKKFSSGRPGAGDIASFTQMKTHAFSEKAAEGGMLCASGSFGLDPMPGHYKHCYCEEPHRDGHKVLAPGGKARFYDAGGSFFGDALSFFLETYRKHGIPMDEVYVWEFNKQGKDNYWAGVDPEIREYWEPRVTFYDGIGVTAAENSEHNPVSRIYKECKPQDFCAFKLDIDTPEVEFPLVTQLLQNPVSTQAALDEFFFEHHVHGFMQSWWGPGVNGTFADSYKLFSDLRNLGVRAHSWV